MNGRLQSPAVNRKAGDEYARTCSDDIIFSILISVEVQVPQLKSSWKVPGDGQGREPVRLHLLLLTIPASDGVPSIRGQCFLLFRKVDVVSALEDTR